MGVFHIFKIVHMIPTRARHHNQKKIVSSLLIRATHKLEMLAIKVTNIWTNFLLTLTRIQKNESNFCCAEMSMMTSQVLKFVDSAKTQKSEYLENKTVFPLLKFTDYLYGAIIG